MKTYLITWNEGDPDGAILRDVADLDNLLKSVFGVGFETEEAEVTTPQASEVSESPEPEPIMLTRDNQEPAVGHRVRCGCGFVYEHISSGWAHLDSPDSDGETWSRITCHGPVELLEPPVGSLMKVTNTFERDENGWRIDSSSNRWWPFSDFTPDVTEVLRWGPEQSVEKSPADFRLGTVFRATISGDRKVFVKIPALSTMAAQYYAVDGTKRVHLSDLFSDVEVLYEGPTE